MKENIPRGVNKRNEKLRTSINKQFLNRLARLDGLRERVRLRGLRAQSELVAHDKALFDDRSNAWQVPTSYWKNIINHMQIFSVKLTREWDSNDDMYRINL